MVPRAEIAHWASAASSTFSTLHLLAHSVWAQSAMAAGGVALVRGKLTSPAQAATTAR